MRGDVDFVNKAVAILVRAIEQLSEIILELKKDIPNERSDSFRVSISKKARERE